MYPHEWLDLPMFVRQIVAKDFKMLRSSYTHVVDNKLVSDGYTVEDLSKISIEELQKRTGSTSDDFMKLLTQYTDAIKPPELEATGNLEIDNGTKPKSRSKK
jgi:hypothetical protein